MDKNDKACHNSDLFAFSELGACEKYFPKLGAHLSMGAYLSPECLIVNMRNSKRLKKLIAAFMKIQVVKV